MITIHTSWGSAKYASEWCYGRAITAGHASAVCKIWIIIASISTTALVAKITIHFLDCSPLLVPTIASALELAFGFLSDVSAKLWSKKKQSINGQYWHGSYCHWFALHLFKFCYAFIAISAVVVKWPQSNTYLETLPATIHHHLPLKENELIFLFILLSISYIIKYIYYSLFHIHIILHIILSLPPTRFPLKYPVFNLVYNLMPVSLFRWLNFWILSISFHSYPTLIKCLIFYTRVEFAGILQPMMATVILLPKICDMWVFDVEWTLSNLFIAILHVILLSMRYF